MGLRDLLRREPRTPEPVIAPNAMYDALLAGLPGHWFIVRKGRHIARMSQGADALGLALYGELLAPELVTLVESVQRSGASRALQVAIGGAEVSAPPRQIRAHAARLDADQVLLLILDISAETRVEEMRRDFITSVSDEMRGPVQAIQSFATQIAGAEGAKALRKAATRIEREAQRLSALVIDLTDLSRLQSSDAMEAARQLQVRACVQQAIDIVARDAQDKRIDIVTDIPELDIYVNEEQLVAALRNLLINAITYSSPHTLVTVKAASDAQHVSIEVHDEGVGIPIEEQASIFDRFHRIDATRSRESGGTGLGLAVVRQICVAHGGDVSVSSEPGRGSVFTLRFPVGRRVTESSGLTEQEEM